ADERPRRAAATGRGSNRRLRPPAAARNGRHARVQPAGRRDPARAVPRHDEAGGSRRREGVAARRERRRHRAEQIVRERGALLLLLRHAVVAAGGPWRAVYSSMHWGSKLHEALSGLQRDPAEGLRLIRIGLATFRFRYVLRSAGPGSVFGTGNRIINASNVRIGRDCLFQDSIYIRAGVRGRVHIGDRRSEEHTSELQSRENLVCRLLLEKKKKKETN